MKKLKNKFIKVTDFNKNKAFVQTLDNNYYCINKNGEILFEIPPFSENTYTSYSYKFDKFNQVIINTDIDGITSSAVLDENGKIIIPAIKGRDIYKSNIGYVYDYHKSWEDVDKCAYGKFVDKNGCLVAPSLVIDKNNFGYFPYRKINDELFIFHCYTHYGLCSINADDFIIPPEYNYMDKIENLLNIHNEDNYLLVRKNKKYGVIDYNNNTLIPCKYENEIYKMGNYYIVSQNNKKGIISINNEIIYDIKYDEILYCYDNCIWAKENNIWKIVYLNGKEIILNYDDCQFPCNNFYLLIQNVKLSEYICVSKNGKWGLVDYKNNQVLPIKFDQIFQYINNDLIEVTYKNRDGLYNFNGEEIIPCSYSLFFDNLENNSIMAIDYDKEIKHYYDNNGKSLLSRNYDSLSHHIEEDTIAIYENGYYKFINIDEKDLF